MWMWHAKQKSAWDHTAIAIHALQSLAAGLAGEETESKWHDLNPYRQHDAYGQQDEGLNAIAEAYMRSIKATELLPPGQADKAIDNITKAYQCRVREYQQDKHSSKCS